MANLSDRSRTARIPGWVIDLPISPFAFKLYVLMRWTEDVEDRGLTLEEMAEELKVDLALIKTTVDELLDAGAIGANGWEVGQ